MYLQSTIASVTFNGAAIATPAWMTMQAAYANNPDLFISFNSTTLCTDIGTYIVKIGTVNVSGYTTVAAVTNTSNPNITIVIVGGTFSVTGSLNASYTNLVPQTTTITLPTFTFTPVCSGETGNEVFTPPAGLPSCVTYTTTAVTATGCSYLDQGTFSFRLQYQVTFNGYTNTMYDNPFDLIIDCVPTSLTNSSSNTSVFAFEIG